MAFFRSMRRGDLICEFMYKVNSEIDLIWDYVIFLDKSILIHIKISKKNIPKWGIGRYI
jgi:hypothetical protein